MNSKIEEVLMKLKEIGPIILDTLSDESYMMSYDGKIARAPRYIHERYEFLIKDKSDLTKKTALVKIKLLIKEAWTESPENGILWEDLRDHLREISEEKLELLNKEINRELV